MEEKDVAYRLGTATHEDIPQLIELRMAYLLADFGMLDARAEEIIRGSLPSFFDRHLGGDLFAYAMRCDDGSIVSIALMLVSEKPPNPRFPHGRIGTVFNVFTAPEHRRRGLARQVMGALVEDARLRGLDLVELNATDDGYGLYKSLGFSDADLHRPLEHRL